jgi:hypothetical protein
MRRVARVADFARTIDENNAASGSRHRQPARAIEGDGANRAMLALPAFLFALDYGDFGNPICRAKSKAPSPVSMTYRPSSRTRRATLIGFFISETVATAPHSTLLQCA